MTKKKSKSASEKKVIGELLKELNAELGVKKTKLEQKLAASIREFTIETGCFVEEIRIDEDSDYGIGDKGHNVEVEIEVILEEQK